MDFHSAIRNPKSEISMPRRSFMRYAALLSVLLYTLLAAGPMLHCHGAEEVPGHQDHCPGCHWTHFPFITPDTTHVTAILTVVEETALPSFFRSPHTPDAPFHNRAPPSV
jgi:hypothetical protein